MEYSPPPLFKQGPSALARLLFFVALALALLVSDARFKTLEIVRGVIGAGLYPLQRAALVPRDVIVGAADIAITSAALRNENAQLHAKNLQLSLQAGQAAALATENDRLRALLLLSQRLAVQSTPAEIQYDTADPFTQRVMIGDGSQQHVQLGAPVVDQDGVVGQVTRVFPMQAEVTLLTDKDLAVPVQVVRTGLRSVVYGTPKGDVLDLRFVPINADLLAGDELVTSGLDGVYPPGLPVAKIVRVDKQADTAFARVVCVPVANVRGTRQLLVLRYQNDIPPRPDELEPPVVGKDARTKKAAKGTERNAAKGTDTRGTPPGDASAVATGAANRARRGEASSASGGNGSAPRHAEPAPRHAPAKTANGTTQEGTR